MKEIGLKTHVVDLEFEEVKLPPFDDILIVGKRSPHGRTGLTRCFQFMMPDEFEVAETLNPSVDSVFIHRNILRKIEKEEVMAILEKKVFPYMGDHEIIKVDFRTRTRYREISAE